MITEALKQYGATVETEARQTVYPDLTVILDTELPNKVAIDIKTTYRKPSTGFTLGSYTAYMRPPFTKNISHPYHEYLEHWIVGFIYSRVPGVVAQITTMDNIKNVVAPINDVEIIIQEKWKVASDKPGSGNTANIGSVGNVAALRDGLGTFGLMGPGGKEVFEDYWRNFDRTPPKRYSNIEGYQAWRRENPI